VSDATGLDEALKKHHPAGPTEREHLATMREFAEDTDRPYDCDNPEGHFVASGLVASPRLDQVVLLHHEQLEVWLQPGGHAEPGETQPREIAEREAREETRLDVEPHPDWPGLVDVDVHEIPATDTMPAHAHLDLRYVFQADPDDEPTAPEDEARDVQWFGLKEAREELDLDEGLQRLLWKVQSLRVDAGYDIETLNSES
jgi:8-oxo-dGTP pyrophosphatase MutT (NUDIX family)